MEKTPKFVKKNGKIKEGYYCEECYNYQRFKVEGKQRSYGRCRYSVDEEIDGVWNQEDNEMEDYEVIDYNDYDYEDYDCDDIDDREFGTPYECEECGSKKIKYGKITTEMKALTIM